MSGKNADNNKPREIAKHIYKAKHVFSCRPYGFIRN